jgi:hypothetical protein
MSQKLPVISGKEAIKALADQAVIWIELQKDRLL